MKKNKRKKNKKGFTLVELLITITILGIIIAIAISSIINLNKKEKKTVVEIYEDSMITAGKLYNDSYIEDTFGKRKNGCAKISYSQLKNKDLIKDLESNQLNCAYKVDSNDSSGLIIRKIDNKYYYETILWCENKSTGEKEQVAGNSDQLFYLIDEDYCNETASEDNDPPGFYYTNANLRYFYNSTNSPQPKLWISDGGVGLNNKVSVTINWTGAYTNHYDKEYSIAGVGNLPKKNITLEYTGIKDSTRNGTYILTLTSKNIADKYGHSLVPGTKASPKKTGTIQKSQTNPETFYVENSDPKITTTTSKNWTNQPIAVNLSADDNDGKGVYSGIRTYKYTVKNGTTETTVIDDQNCGTVSTEPVGTGPKNSSQATKSCSFTINGTGNYPNGNYEVKTTAIDWAGNKSTSSNYYRFDNAKPNISITRTAYNKYKWTADDKYSGFVYSGLNGHVDNKNSATPTSGWTGGATATGTVTITTAGTYYTHIRDNATNTNKASIAAYTVTRSQGTGTTLTTKFESSTGTAFTNNPVVLNGTPIYITGKLSAGYGSLVLKYGGTTITSGTTKNVSGNVTISSSATKCPAGKWNDGTHATCQNCPQGYTSDAGATAQNKCYINVDAAKRKTTATGTATTSCGTGYYKAAHKSYYGDSDSCNHCPSGYRDGAATSVRSNCKKSVRCGYHVATARRSETKCGAGKYRTAHTVKYGDTSNCSSCGSGKTSNAGSCSSSNCRTATTHIRLCRRGNTCIDCTYTCHYALPFGTEFDAVSSGNDWKIKGGAYDGCRVSKNCVGATECSAAQCPDL